MSRIGIVGSGVVGSATGQGLARHGHDITFFDLKEEVLEGLQARGFTALTPSELDMSKLDVVCISVSTPLTEKGINFGALQEVTMTIAEKLRRSVEGFPVVVYRTTMPPGMLRADLLPRLELFSGRTAGEDFGVVFWPEFLRAETALADFLHPQGIVISTPERNDRACEALSEVMRAFNQPVTWFSFDEAALLKLYCNAINTFTILAGQVLRPIGERSGIDSQPLFQLATRLAEGRRNPEYGMRNRGPAGGSCLPKDLAMLIMYAEGRGANVSLLEAAQQFNNAALQAGEDASASQTGV